MSYILEALRRSDAERRGRQAGGDRVPAARRRRSGLGRSALLTVLALLLLLNGAALAVWAWRWTAGEADPATPRDEIAEMREAPQQEPSELARTAANDRAWPEPWQVEQPPKERSPDRSGRDATPEAESAPAPEPAPEESTTQLRETDRPEPTASDSAEATPSDDSNADDVPLLAQLPEALRERVGPLDVGVHVYSGSPERGFLLLDGQRLRPGERLDNGLELVAMAPDGAQFRFEGERFRVVLR